MYVVPTYLTYLALSVAATISVAHTLHRNGRLFLIEAFHGNVALADSVNHLLVVGFYLVNLGYVTLALRSEEPMNTARQSIELASSKIGVVLVVLGLLHFGNLYVFSRIRRRAAA